MFKNGKATRNNIYTYIFIFIIMYKSIKKLWKVPIFEVVHIIHIPYFGDDW